MGGVRTGIVTGREITTNKDGENPRMMLQVQLSSPDDIQTVEYVSLPGIDASPINGSRVFVAAIANSYLIAFGVDDGVVSKVGTGEQSLYAVDDNGVIQCFIDLLKTGRVDILGVAASIFLLESGIIEINGNADFAVRFTALETALQTMVTQFNAALGTKLDGSGTPGTVALDISGAKVDEVKLP